jgi:nickel/cobalt transporter (NicO) family protein
MEFVNEPRAVLPRETACAGSWRCEFDAPVLAPSRCRGDAPVRKAIYAPVLARCAIVTAFVGIGTAITVGTIATLAVGAKAVAKRLARERAGYGSVLVRGAEVGAAALVFAFGVLLLTGHMVSERMVGF